MKIIARFSARLSTLRPMEELLLVVFVTALAALPVYGLSSPVTREFNLFYMLPVLIPFGMFLYDRFRNPPRRPFSIFLDLLVVTISVARVFVPIPFVSGHALFLSYATLATSRILTRIVCGFGLWYTAYDKLSNFGDLRALVGGVVIGTSAALLYRISSKATEQDATTSP